MHLTRRILALAIPAFAALIAQPLMLLADTWVAGYLGTDSLAGLGVGSGLLTTVTGLMIFLAYGSTSVVSRQLGAGNRTRGLELGVQAMWLALVLGSALAVVAWVAVERRTASPLVPPSLFGSRVFSAANAMTVLVYGALGGVSLFTVLQLQAAGWGALEAGLSGLPITIALLLFSSRAAALSARIGPRIPMTVGPLLCAWGALLLLLIADGATWLRVLPGMVVFSLGLALLVSPLTAAVLAAAPGRYAGAASGVNNAVARAGSLLAVAALPALVGLGGDDYLDLDAMTSGFRGAMLWCAGLLALGGVVSWFGLARQEPG